MSRPKTYPPHVGTIGGVIRTGHGLHLYCLNRECQHKALAASIGTAHTPDDKAAALVAVQALEEIREGLVEMVN